MKLKRMKKIVQQEDFKRKYVYKAKLRDDYGDYYVKQEVVENPHEGNLVISQTWEGGHAPVLDIDFPIHVVPSKTEGHFHLYIDRVIDWKDYKKLLDVMLEIGFINDGWYKDAIINSRTAVRNPLFAMANLGESDVNKEAI